MTSSALAALGEDSGQRRSTVFALIVKYSTLLVALSYVTGFIANAEFGTAVGVDVRGEISVVQPRMFAYGAAIIPLFSLGALLVVLILSLRIFERVQQHVPYRVAYHVVLIGIPLVAATALVFLARSHGSDSPQSAVIWSSLLLGNVILASLLTAPMPNASQVTVRIVTVAALLFLFSGAAADVEAERAKRDPRRDIQFLIAPEAVDGARQLGIPFTRPLDQSPMELTQPVHLVYSGERTYALRLADGRLVQLSKDKVWGFTRRR